MWMENAEEGAVRIAIQVWGRESEGKKIESGDQEHIYSTPSPPRLSKYKDLARRQLSQTIAVTLWRDPFFFFLLTKLVRKIAPDVRAGSMDHKMQP